MSIQAALFAAVWMGLLTSVSPCPLASNIAAISFIGRKANSHVHVFGSGVFYTLGRTAAYIAVSALVLTGLLAGGELSRFLQLYMNQILGPVLILTGMLLLEWLGFTFSVNLAGSRVQAHAAKGGMLWAFVMGMLFALSFCPVSAGLFFGGLIPLAAKAESRFLLPAVFGIGTALPVIGFAFLIAFAAKQVGTWFGRLTQVEKWVRAATGSVFIVVGVYYCLRHIYGVQV